jgi:tRNA-specific 2-thiouridylase
MTKVLVGISGGVDSSVTALLLRQQGFQVEGILFKQVSESADCDDYVCCAETAISRARTVCDDLGIPLHTPDVRALFKSKVIDPSIAAWQNGDVPSPCTTCNADVRAPLLNYYREVLECDYFATGHYFITSGERVFRGKDPRKDQSYMVSLVSRSLISRWLTPLGEYLKSDVRKIAADNSVATAEVADSQNLCFNHLLPNFSRPVFKDAGSGLVQIGSHTGRPAAGQRKGFGGNTVAFVDKEKIIVAESAPRQCRIPISWKNYPGEVAGLTAQVSYHGHVIPVVSIDDRSVTLATPVTLNPGQVCAVFRKEELVGGGVIIRE